MVPSREFWRGKRVLLTGHTGFKGAWLALWLKQLGAQVFALSLPPKTSPSLFDLAAVGQMTDSYFCDVGNAVELAGLIKFCRPEVVFHLAAQSLVRTSYRDPLETFSVNVMGTANLLNGLRAVDSVRVAVMVTTDKVYRNLEQPYPYREDDALGGHDPYSASKAASEIVIASYRDAFLAERGVAIASARAGNVIGGGDWSEDRLIPDAIRAWQGGQTLRIRRPQAVRPWQHVLEPLCAYLVLAENLWCRPDLAGAYNFGPRPHEATTVWDVVEIARQVYGGGGVSYEEEVGGPHEAGFLALETAKTRAVLGLQPRWGLAEAVTRTMRWYRSLHDGKDARQLCLADIDGYVSGASQPQYTDPI